MNAQLPTGVLIASDHAGVETKSELVAFLASMGFEVTDLGPSDTTSVDYPDFAHRLARAVASEDDRWGVLICGSGIGMSIAANKINGARAALVHDDYTARMARQHNDANIVVLGARVLGPDILKSCLRTFSHTAFDAGSDGRHARRVSKIEG